MRLPRVTLLFVCVFAAAVLAACSSGGGGSQGNRLEPKDGDVFLDAYDQIGSLPFTSSVALATVPQVAAGSLARGSSTQGLRYVDGTTASLYGGSGSQQLCDATTAITLLLDDNDKAQAWVGSPGTELEFAL